MSALDAYVGDGIANGRFIGVQAYASVHGQVIVDTGWGVDGRNTPLMPGDLMALYCASKPVLAVAVASLVASGDLDLRESVGAAVGRTCELSSHVAKLSVYELLSHRTGLENLTGVLMGLHTPEERSRTVCFARPSSEYSAGRRAYSEYAGWHLLSMIVEEVTGLSAVAFVGTLGQRDGVSMPSGLFLAMSQEEFCGNRDRVRINLVYGSGGKRRPLLMEQSQRICTELNPSFGGYASMRSLGQFYEELLQRRRHNDEFGRVLAAFTTCDGPAAYDPSLDRVCSFGLGFMTDLSSHYYGNGLSGVSFGHSGNVGALLGCADPATGLVATIAMLGTRSAETAVYHHRGELMQKILEEARLLS